MQRTVTGLKENTEILPAQPGFIGDYEIIEMIGKGGMGIVYKARHRFLDQTVAIKVLPHTLLDDPKIISRFHREMQLIGRLNHPNVVRALNAGEIDASPYLVMEYVNGISLENLVRQHKMSFGSACEAVRQTALGLQNIHELQLVHRDIKPANLMVDQHGTVKILDLGLGKIQTSQADALHVGGETSLTMVGMTLGTADYISPEQCENASSADIRSDLYSLGCTLHYLLVGVPVYSGSRYAQLRNKLLAHMLSEPPKIRSIIPSLPEAFETVFDKVLAKLPADRYQMPVEFAEALEPFANFDEFYSELQAAGAINVPTFLPSSDILSSRSRTTVSRKRFWILTQIAVHLVVFGGLFGIALGVLHCHNQSLHNPAPAGSVEPGQGSTKEQIAESFATTLALLPGLNGHWWFDEIPWLMPSVRQVIIENNPAPFDLKNPDISSVDTSLRTLMKDVTDKVPPDVRILINQLQTLPRVTTVPAEDTKTMEAFYTQLHNAFADKHQQRGCDWHTLALLEHRLALLTRQSEHIEHAEEHYKQALKQYQTEAAAGQSVSRKLEFLCRSDFARLPADGKVQLERFQGVTRERKSGESLDTLFLTEYRTTFGRFCASIRQYDDTQFTRAKESLMRDANIKETHPLMAYVCEQYAWSLVDQKKMTEAYKQLTDAIIIRGGTHFLQTKYQPELLQAYRDYNSRSLLLRYSGRTMRAADEFRSVLRRYAESPMNAEDAALAVVAAETKERLADCTLFGGASSERIPARLETAEKLYAEAKQPIKEAVTLLLQDKLDEAKRILTDVQTFVSAQQAPLFQFAEALSDYKLTGKRDQLRQFLLQSSVLNKNEFYAVRMDWTTSELRIFTTEFLVNEDLKRNDLAALRDDVKLLAQSVIYYQGFPEARPFIRRSCDMLVRSLAILYENQVDAAVKKDFLDLIVRVLVAQRDKPKPAATAPPTANGVPRALPTYIVYFLADDAKDGFVIFYPQDARGGSFFRLPLTRREVKTGQVRDGVRLLDPELVRLVQAEHQAGKTVTMSWNDETAYAQPETALLDADYPFKGLDTP